MEHSKSKTVQEGEGEARESVQMKAKVLLIWHCGLAADEKASASSDVAEGACDPRHVDSELGLHSQIHLHLVLHAVHRISASVIRKNTTTRLARVLLNCIS